MDDEQVTPARREGVDSVDDAFARCPGGQSGAAVRGNDASIWAASTALTTRRWCDLKYRSQKGLRTGSRTARRRLLTAEYGLEP
jgi:hypothetical protein